MKPVAWKRHGPELSRNGPCRNDNLSFATTPGQTGPVRAPFEFEPGLMGFRPADRVARMDRIRYRCTVAAILIWMLDGAKVVRDQISTGNADWVPFLAFTGLMVLLALPILLGKSDA